jgi:hypothetical protein
MYPVHALSKCVCDICNIYLKYILCKVGMTLSPIMMYSYN